MSNWSGLPCELLISVVEHIEKLEDFISFGAVCKGWHAAGKKEYFKGLWLRQGTPYVMLRDSDDNDDTCRFYSLVEDEIVASVRISTSKSKKYHESLGWLLAADKDGSMFLLNPFSSVEIPVPHQRCFLDYNQFSMDGHVFVQKMVLSTRPSETRDFILMVICRGGFLAFWRPGDQSWNKITILGSRVRDVSYHDGHFYVIGNRCAWVLTLERDNPPMCQIVTRFVDVANDNDEHEVLFKKYVYILKTSRSLFLISRTAPWFIRADYRCHVYEVDMSTGTLAEINNIGNMAIFVGHNTTFAVDTSRFSGSIKGNRIYFTHDGWEYFELMEQMLPKTWGEYNVETGKIEMVYHRQLSFSKACPPIWITPCF